MRRLSVRLQTVFAAYGAGRRGFHVPAVLNSADPVDLKAIIFSAIIIGALGAIMDVAMDIASALNELAATTAEPTRKMLLQAGNNIGRDILGMMSNTLILAYIGGSLTIVLLFFAYNHSLLYLLNKEMVVVEILQAVIGSFGILFTIPFTSFICSRLYVKRPEDVISQAWK